MAQAKKSALAEVPSDLNAVADWVVEGGKSTANVEAALIRPDGRPVSFTGRLRDIARIRGSISVAVDVDAWASQVLRFQLQCTQAEAMLREQPGRALVGVARVAGVKMTRDTTMLALAEIERRFLATGECLYLKTFER